MPLSSSKSGKRKFDSEELANTYEQQKLKFQSNERQAVDYEVLGRQSEGRIFQIEEVEAKYEGWN